MCHALRLILLVAATLAGNSLAQTPASPDPIGLDCWIGHDDGQLRITYIRCIADRDLPHPELAQSRLDAFLEDLHRELHQKSGADAERIYKANIGLVRETASVWNIRIFSEPYEWSWQEGRPQQLVRAVLCPPDVPCTVNVLRR